MSSAAKPPGRVRMLTGVTGLDAVTVTFSASEATSRVSGPVESLSFAFTTRLVRSAVLKPASVTWSV